jgi:hypothetical protein
VVPGTEHDNILDLRFGVAERIFKTIAAPNAVDKPSTHDAQPQVVGNV